MIMAGSEANLIYKTPGGQPRGKQTHVNTQLPKLSDPSLEPK
jgi:hypothetical protein